MQDERMKILEMLAQGKISAAEANDILGTLDDKDVAKPQRQPRFLKIRVAEDGKEKVNVNLPISLAKIAVKFLPEEAKKEIARQGIDLDDILTLVASELTQGPIVTVDDGDDHVEIFVE